MLHRSFLLLASIIFYSSAAFAQDTLIEEEEVTVFGFLLPQSIEQTTFEVGLLDARDLELSSYPDLGRTLDELPGVFVANQGGLGGVTSVFVRGEDSYRTRLYLDGMELLDLSTPQASVRFDYAALPAIERVELLYGAQALTYSADAAGVFAVQSRRGDLIAEGESDVLVSGSIGKYSTYQTGLAYRAHYASGDHSIAVNQLSSDGFNARSDDEVDNDDNDGMEQTTVTARLTRDLGDDGKLYGSFFRSAGENQYDNTFNAAPSNDFDQTAFLLGLSEEYDNGLLAVEYSQTIGEREDGDFVRSRGKLEKIELKNAFTLAKDHQINFLAGIRNESLSDFVNGSKDTRSQHYIAGDYQIDMFEGLALNAGIRLDDTEVAGSFSSYRAGVKYRSGFYTPLSARFDVSTGFRLPSFSEIDYNQGPFASDAAPDEFEPEEATSVSLTTRLDYDKASVGLTLFNSEIENLIYFDNIGFAGYFQSAADSRSRGATLDFEVQPVDFFKAFGSYTYNDNRIGESDIYFELNGDFERLGRPRDQYELTLRGQTSEEKVVVDLRFYGRAHTPGYVFFEGPVELDNYDLLDLEVFYKLTKDFTIWARAENILDEEYVVVRNFNTAERSAYIGFTLQL